MTTIIRSIKLAAMCTSLFALASQSQAANVWFQGPLTMVYPMSDGSFVLGIEGDLPCGSSGTIRYLSVTPGANGVTLDGAKNFLAVALTAFALEKNLQIVYENSSTSCYVNRLIMLK